MVSQHVVRFDRSRFPDSDGDPMPETESHQQQLTDLKHACRALLAARAEVYVGGNHFLYYDRSDPAHNVAPDVYAAFGVGPGERECYFAFLEGVFPQLVVEVISKSSLKDDLGTKVALYAAQGAEEYYVCDPRPKMRGRRLHAWRRVGEALVPVLVGEDGRVRSALLGTELVLVGRFLRIIDPTIGEPIPTASEEAAARIAAERARDAEARARATAERRARREAVARRAAGRHAEQESLERQAAEQSRDAAEHSRDAAEQRAVQAEALVASLRAQLSERSGGDQR